MSTADESNGASRLGESDSAPSEALDPLETVRRHPEWYFRNGRFDRDEAIGLLVAEAVRGGGADITVKLEDEWVIVSADKDWLTGDIAAFVSPQADPAGGVNSSRIEVALVAFCRVVLTATPDDPIRYWSNLALEPVPSGREEWLRAPGRVVAFLPPGDHGQFATSQPVSATSRKPRLRLVPNSGEGAISAAVRNFMEKESRLKK